MPMMTIATIRSIRVMPDGSLLDIAGGPDDSDRRWRSLPGDLDGGDAGIGRRAGTVDGDGAGRLKIQPARRIAARLHRTVLALIGRAIRAGQRRADGARGIGIIRGDRERDRGRGER